MATGSSSQSPGRRVFMMLLVYCIVLYHYLVQCLSCPLALRDTFHTPVAQYSLFILKVPIS